MTKADVRKALSEISESLPKSITFKVNPQGVIFTTQKLKSRSQTPVDLETDPVINRFFDLVEKLAKKKNFIEYLPIFESYFPNISVPQDYSPFSKD